MIRKAITIFRRSIIVLLTLTGLTTALAWATSYDDASDPAYLLDRVDSYVYPLNPQACFYLTSLSGWVRVGSVRVDDGTGSIRLWEGNEPSISNADIARFWLAVRQLPRPDVVNGLYGTTHLGGLFLTVNLVSGWLRVLGFAFPHWVLCVAFLTYPILAFIRGPLRSYRRRRRGLCLKCGYDLRGTNDPRCPECGTAFNPKNPLPTCTSHR